MQNAWHKLNKAVQNIQNVILTDDDNGNSIIKDEYNNDKEEHTKSTERTFSLSNLKTFSQISYDKKGFHLSYDNKQNDNKSFNEYENIENKNNNILKSHKENIIKNDKEIIYNMKNILYEEIINNINLFKKFMKNEKAQLLINEYKINYYNSIKSDFFFLNYISISKYILLILSKFLNIHLIDNFECIHINNKEEYEYYIKNLFFDILKIENIHHLYDNNTLSEENISKQGIFNYIYKSGSFHNNHNVVEINSTNKKFLEKDTVQKNEASPNTLIRCNSLDYILRYKNNLTFNNEKTSPFSIIGDISSKKDVDQMNKQMDIQHDIHKQNLNNNLKREHVTQYNNNNEYAIINEKNDNNHIDISLMGHEQVGQINQPLYTDYKNNYTHSNNIYDDNNSSCFYSKQTSNKPFNNSNLHNIEKKDFCQNMENYTPYNNNNNMKENSLVNSKKIFDPFPDKSSLTECEEEEFVIRNDTKIDFSKIIKSMKEEHDIKIEILNSKIKILKDELAKNNDVQTNMRKMKKDIEKYQKELDNKNQIIDDLHQEKNILQYRLDELELKFKENTNSGDTKEALKEYCEKNHIDKQIIIELIKNSNDILKKRNVKKEIFLILCNILGIKNMIPGLEEKDISEQFLEFMDEETK
ncbi:conserved Plasmodium protein, unknown function [Plasmodium gaboni]|uniref:GRIP domain-containing protein n=1 Tax=Plasmodium gaboni TaxID=647221 RepID=A0ABY1UN85_9APIC|nr:conserved Plasmodium protein, unknown function [Plasmodium gaboni]